MSIWSIRRKTDFPHFQWLSPVLKAIRTPEVHWWPSITRRTITYDSSTELEYFGIILNSY